jgi:hypothetical protein
MHDVWRPFFSVMATKLWFQQGESDPYELTIPAGCENVSNIITHIGTTSFIKTQLKIPNECGTITLFFNGEHLKTTLLLNNFTERGIGTDGETPIIVLIHSSKGPSRQVSQAYIFAEPGTKDF